MIPYTLTHQYLGHRAKSCPVPALRAGTIGNANCSSAVARPHERFQFIRFRPGAEESPTSKRKATPQNVNICNLLAGTKGWDSLQPRGSYSRSHFYSRTWAPVSCRDNT